MSLTSTNFDITGFLASLTRAPGVYRMLDTVGRVLYVGKARDLKKRLASYFRNNLSLKTRVLMEQMHSIEVTVTHTESEALILENNLIKEFKPRYNILLRDDKSYPYIYLSSHEDFPRLDFHRGAKDTKGRYFGPYPSAASVRESLTLLQKLFRVRQCEDSFYHNRSRPCLQYQIQRCTAPCVGLVDREHYQQDVRLTALFLEGKDQQVIEELITRMEVSAVRLEFEEAARYRDQIATLGRIRERQYVSGEKGDLDVVVSAVQNELACVEVFYIRAGRVLGNRTFYPQHTAGVEAAEVLEAFLPQYYLGRKVPSEILVSSPLVDQALLERILGEQNGRRVCIRHQFRGERARWVKLARTNAEHALARQLHSKTNMLQRFEALQEALNLPDLPSRIECLDISHSGGEATVASCVVFESDGPVKADYRRYNIEGITGGDDYAAMRQALIRRYMRLKQGEGKLPDILLIDGGKGQVSEAKKVLQELQIADVLSIGIAKGPMRKPGTETLFLSETPLPFILPATSSALHLIQQIRDEAHRFAITGHRQRREKARVRSPLENIVGLGPKRRRLLLTHLGGLQEVTRAGVEELIRVPGINKELAQRIYDLFHDDQGR